MYSLKEGKNCEYIIKDPYILLGNNEASRRSGLIEYVDYVLSKSRINLTSSKRLQTEGEN